MAVEYKCCEPRFFLQVLMIVLLVLFAGLMSGLTLGLMSLSQVELEVTAASGQPRERKYAKKILPVVKRQHLLLCTLLICNAAAMEALPLFLDSIVTAWQAILISVTLILLFGEIIPQSLCTRYGLAIGAAAAPLVRALVFICFPVSYPISKLLDYMLGPNHSALFRKAELKTLVTFHGNEAGKGGELTHDETTIIAGALELHEKMAKDAMTPISETFAVDINAKLDRDLMKLILDKGHSRVPVYYEQRSNIIGIILVKNLLSIHPADETPIKHVTIRKIPKIPETMPLDDILNEFQKGLSHMAAVIRPNNPPDQPLCQGDDDIVPKEVKLDIIDEEKRAPERKRKNNRTVQKWKSVPSNSQITARGSLRRLTRELSKDVLHIDENTPPLFEEEAIGIITMEDVIEELLQEEIYDETDFREDL